MPIGRVAENALTLLILFGFFYIIYMGMKGQSFGGLEKLKGLFKWGKK